jgi:hypothetical protein
VEDIHRAMEALPLDGRFGGAATVLNVYAAGRTQ